MAFENGSNIYSYSEEIFERYKEDEFVFMKAIQTVQYFQTRPDYPYSMPELDKSISKILGQSLTDIAYGPYKYIFMEEPVIEWNPRDVYSSYSDDKVDLVVGIDKDKADNLAINFKNEFTSFCHSLSLVLDKIFLMEDSPMKLSRVTLSELSDSKQIMRLIRNDGELLDLEIDEYDISFIIETLKGDNNG